LFRLLTILNHFEELYLTKKRARTAILILKIGFLKASLRLDFKKPIWGFPAPQALENPKLVSSLESLELF
jgi:hypothetical protein